MSNWLEQLERELDERLSAFLRNNPVQHQLFQDQHQQDRAQALERQRQQLQQDAEQLRGQLLTLVTEVRAWTDRMDRARRAGALDLAQRAQAHLDGLMAQGRTQWSDLANLGRRFSEVEAQLQELSRQAQSSRPGLDDDWARFEAEQELEQLRREGAELTPACKIQAFGAGGSSDTLGRWSGSGSAMSMCWSTISGRSLSRHRMR